MDKTEPTDISELLQQDILFADSLWQCRRDKRRTPCFAERFKGPRSSQDYSVHDFWEFTVVSNGTMLIDIDEQSIRLKKYDVLLIPPGKKHRESAGSPVETIWCGFLFDGLDLARDGFHLLNSERLAEKMHSFWRLASHRTRLVGLELEGEWLKFLGEYLRLLCSDDNTTIPMEKVILFFQDHFHLPIDMSDIAATLNVSESYFYRQFKMHTGLTPLQYLSHLRLKNVMTHLRKTNLTLRQIAGICGYSDPYYLSRSFKRHFGLSPQAYRNKIQ